MIRFHYDPNVPHALYLCDFGGAHGRSIYGSPSKMVEDITSILKDNKLLTKEGGYFIYGMTNSNQTDQRKMLDGIGFKRTNIGNLVQHSITHVEFAKAAEAAIEAIRKEEERIKAELAAAEKARRDRDLKEGREPGELRVGDVLYYRPHTPDQHKTHHYVCVGLNGKQLQYTSVTSFSHYTLDYLKKAGNWILATEWLRADPAVEEAAIKRYPNIRPPVSVEDPTKVTAKKAPLKKAS